MIIEDFKKYSGQHCETTAIGSLLMQIGIELSEPMLFGIGEGLGFIYWNMKIMDFPFIGGRVKPDVITENICNNLNLQLDVKETSSKKTAWENVTRYIDAGKAVGVKLDCYYLDYFTEKFHFAGHYVAMYGYDKKYVYLIDTDQQGGEQKTSPNSFELARNEKGPMSSRNKSYTIDSINQDKYDLKKIIVKAIYNNALDFLNPPISNIGYKGIKKASKEIKKWFQTTKDIKRDFQTTAMLMEKAGTGGSLFRNLYRDFLKESCEIIYSGELESAYYDYVKIAGLWKEVSELFYQAGETQDIEYINQASEILKDLSQRERTAMEKLVMIDVH